MKKKSQIQSQNILEKTQNRFLKKFKKQSLLFWLEASQSTSQHCPACPCRHGHTAGPELGLVSTLLLCHNSLVHERSWSMKSEEMVYILFSIVYSDIAWSTHQFAWSDTSLHVYARIRWPRCNPTLIRLNLHVQHNQIARNSLIIKFMLEEL